jgi:hypothetical protein
MVGQSAFHLSLIFRPKMRSCFFGPIFKESAPGVGGYLAIFSLGIAAAGVAGQKRTDNIDPDIIRDLLGREYSDIILFLSDRLRVEAF